ITYLGRVDLAHVTPEDLRGDAMNRPEDFDDEEVVEERIVEPKPVPQAFATPKTDHLKPLHGNGHGNGHKPAPALTEAVANRGGVALAPTEEKVRQAKLKGYEGDPCPECGQLTLVRSGACCKCDTCGASSGCS